MCGLVEVQQVLERAERLERSSTSAGDVVQDHGSRAGRVPFLVGWLACGLGGRHVLFQALGVSWTNAHVTRLAPGHRSLAADEQRGSQQQQRGCQFRAGLDAPE
jgi:hypothetical protein